MAKQFKWINNDIDISSFYDRLSSVIKSEIKDAEECDKNNSLMAYLNACDSIEVRAKMLVPDRISKKEWELLCDKYSAV